LKKKLRFNSPRLLLDVSAMSDSCEAKGNNCLLDSFKTLFQAKCVKSLMSDRPVITVRSDEEPIVAFKRLVDNRILSAPVLDVRSHKYCGFLDVRDMVSFVVTISDFEEAKKQEEDEHKKLQSQMLSDTTPRHDFFVRSMAKHQRVDQATMYQDPKEGFSCKYLAARNKFVPVKSTDSLFKVAELLANPKVHRVPVLNEENQLVDIISQSTMLKYIQKHVQDLEPGMSVTLEQLGMARKPVATVKSTDTALEVFRVLSMTGRSGLAIVDEDGALVANISASDMKLFIANPSFSLLQTPIIEYLNIIRRQKLKETVPVVIVKQHHTLAKVIRKLVATGMHRVFVVDDEHKPIGVVSLTDIMQHVVHFAASASPSPSPSPLPSNSPVLRPHASPSPAPSI